MQITFAQMFRIAFLAAVAAGMTACGIDSQEAPSLIGPSGLAQTVAVSASPDRLPRDGSSQSVITVTVRNDVGQVVGGQRVTLGSNLGTLSHAEVVTASDGRATVTLTAPPPGSTGNTIDVFVTPVGGNAADVLTRTLSIAMTGISNATAPTPTFTTTPAAPVLRENVVFDASATTDEGVVCLDACSYNWDFGDGTTATGRIFTRQFQTAQTYTVRLSVTDPAGTSASTIRNILVGEGTAPVASFTYSPSSPALFEQVSFNAQGSRAGVPGRTITAEWDFGDGSTGSGMTTSHAYNSLGAYVVTLTVTDNAGVRSTTTQTVTVGSGLTAAFTFSPTDPVVGDTVFFDAESSGGAAGFGGRSPIVLYLWNFGDGTTGTGITTSHAYTAAREYIVTLTVEDAAGRRATTTQSVSVDLP